MLRPARSSVPALVAVALSLPALSSGAAPPASQDLPRALLAAVAPFPVGPDGTVSTTPGKARCDVVTRTAGTWKVESFEDPESNVFHKVLGYAPPNGPPGLLTLGGNAARVKLWRRGAAGWRADEVLWAASWSPNKSRMRDAEIGALLGAEAQDVAVATHDQGVVAVIHPQPGGGYEVRELDREASTFVHEIEIGDLDGDGTREVYATPSEPNRLDGTPQSGKVVRYLPAKQQGRTVVADLGDRHAKEILVHDVDGDGRDELYVSLEGKTEGKGTAKRILEKVEIRRYDADTPPTARRVVATLDDWLTRFLTAGDVDGDGRTEVVAASFRAGLTLLRPGTAKDAPWTATTIDGDSSGFEHAALLADLDQDRVDELYVASDDQGELRRYQLRSGKWEKEVLARWVPRSVFTWNLTWVPIELVRPQ